jgi:hypothetical protein
MARDAAQNSLETSGRLPSVQLRLPIVGIVQLRTTAVLTNIVWGG